MKEFLSPKVSFDGLTDDWQLDVANLFDSVRPMNFSSHYVSDWFAGWFYRPANLRVGL